MKKDVLEKSTTNFLSIPPIIHRALRQKIARSAPGDVFEKIITSVHSEIIWLLNEEGPQNIGDIADQLKIAKAQMTQLTEKLVELNIVERRAVKGDRRKIELALTDIGRAFIEEHKKSVDKLFMDSMTDLTEKDLKSLAEALTTVKNILSKLK